MKPDSLSNAQIATLIAVRNGLPQACCVLIGAAALGCHLEMTWRKTADLDLTILADQHDVFAALSALGWTRDLRREHCWRSKAGIRVDVLPVDRAALQAGRIEFDESKMVMSVVGFDLLLAHVER
ncbi:MAG: hypothetical protein AB7K71_07610, partial [Polyangiaceae bacterium]